MSVNEIIWGLVGFLLTIMALSYLLGDNFFFRLAMFLFVGVTAGYLGVLILHQILWPYLVVPLATGTLTERLWLIPPLILAALLLLSQIRRFAGLGSMPLAFLTGIAAGATIGSVLFGTLLPQSLAVMAAFDPDMLLSEPGTLWLRVLDGVVMLVGVVTTLGYFYLGSRKAQSETDSGEQRPPVFAALGKVGGIFLGITLGTLFAGVFSTVLMAFIDRIIFMGDFLMALFGGS